MTRLFVDVSDNLNVMCERAEAILRNSPDGDVIYQRGSALVQVLMHMHGAQIEAISLATLTRIVSGIIEWRKYKPGKGEEAAQPYGVLPPREVVAALHSAGLWSFRDLRGIIQAPTLRPDGSLLNLPGYDSVTRLYFAPCPAEIADIRVREKPTRDQAVAALAFLDEVFSDFLFAGDEFRSACYSVLFTLLFRSSIPGSVPIFSIEAPARGSGKSLLARFLGLLATGRDPSASPQPRSEDEDCKRITVQVAKGATLIWIDNVVGRFGSPTLAALITSPYWDDRIIGTADTGPWPNLTVWLVTGNNMSYHAELMRRVLPVYIDTGLESPETRSGFAHPDWFGYVSEVRGKVIAAALTVARAYFVAGRPMQGLQAYGSFEGWSRWIRDPLVWLGRADPCQARARVRSEDDSEEQAFGRMMQVWHQKYGSDSIALRDAIESDSDLLLETLEILAPGKGRDKIDVKTLGYVFRSNKGHPIGGYRCLATSKSSRGQKYKVQKSESSQGVLHSISFPSDDESIVTVSSQG